MIDMEKYKVWGLIYFLYIYIYGIDKIYISFDTLAKILFHIGSFNLFIHQTYLLCIYYVCGALGWWLGIQR